MTYETVTLSLDLPWTYFLIYWIVKAAKTHKTARKEPPRRATESCWCLSVATFSSSAAMRALEFWASVLCRASLQCDSRHRPYLARHRPRHLGSPPLGGKLERTRHHQRRPRTHPHRPLRASAPSHLYRASSSDARFRRGYRRVAVFAGCLPRADRIFDQSQAGGSHANPEIWRRIPRPSQAHRFPPAAPAMSPSTTLAWMPYDRSKNLCAV